MEQTLWEAIHTLPLKRSLHHFKKLNLFMPSEEQFQWIDGKKTFEKIDRYTRTMIWLFKMLKDYADTGRFNGARIIDELSYNGNEFGIDYYYRHPRSYARRGIESP